MVGWRDNLERNWVYMLAATLLSVLLWVAVSAEDMTERIVPTDLLVINSDSRYVLASREPETETVNVRYAGRAGDLVALAVARPRIVITIDTVRSQLEEIELEPSMVRGRGSLDLDRVRALDVDPDRVRLRFEPRAQKVVRVVPRVRLSLADGYTLADSVRARPGVVAVEGPENVVSRIDSVVTVLLVQGGLRESITREVPLEQPEAGGLVEMSSATVMVTVVVESIGERVFPGIPVAVRTGSMGESVRVEPPLVDVHLTGPRSALEAVRPDGLSPTVELNDTSDIGQRLPIVLPVPQPFLRAFLEPDSARVVRLDR